MSSGQSVFVACLAHRYAVAHTPDRIDLHLARRGYYSVPDCHPVGSDHRSGLRHLVYHLRRWSLHLVPVGRIVLVHSGWLDQLGSVGLVTDPLDYPPAAHSVLVDIVGCFGLLVDPVAVLGFAVALLPVAIPVVGPADSVVDQIGSAAAHSDFVAGFVVDPVAGLADFVVARIGSAAAHSDFAAGFVVGSAG